MSDWLSPLWYRDASSATVRKPDLRLHHIPFGWSVLNRPMSNIQVLADSADDEDFGAEQIMAIRGYFDFQFRGVTFIYRSGNRRSFGTCVGASSEFNLDPGERVYAMRYRPGINFALHVRTIINIH